MNISIYKNQKGLMYKGLCLFMAVSFILTTSLPTPAVAQSVLNLPAPGSMINLSASSHNPIMIKGITVYPENPFQFDFIVDPGKSNFAEPELKAETEILIRYFLAALTLPEDELWVNLSPYEKDRIIPQGLGDTEMGRDLLVQDYMLKQLTASLMYPENELGSAFWNRVYTKAQEKYGTTDIPMNTFNKIWIVPERAEVYVEGKSAFVVDSYLKVMLEEDYISLEANVNSTKHGLGDVQRKDIDIISGTTSKVLKDILIPEIEKEVNEGSTFAKLRQIYNAVILATWYKQNLKESLLGQIYIDQNKTKGVDVTDKQIYQKIYKQYIQAFETGVYNFIKEEYDASSQQIVTRKYFSGGVNIKSNQTLKTSGLGKKRGNNSKRPTIISTIMATAMIITASIAPLSDTQAAVSSKSKSVLGDYPVQDQQGFVKGFQQVMRSRMLYFKRKYPDLTTFTALVVDMFGEGRASRNFRESTSRHYSRDPHIVGELIAYSIGVAKEVGFSAGVKHFLATGSAPSITLIPGADFDGYRERYHDGDTHKGLVILSDQREKLDEYILPYKYAIEANVSTIMLGHNIMPAISNRPMSISPEATKLLRDMGFKGLIIADEMRVMKGLTNFYAPIRKGYNFPGEEEVLVDMIQAGVDMIINFDKRSRVPGWFDKSLALINDQIEGGNTELRDQINQSVNRILRRKLEVFGEEWLDDLLAKKNIDGNNLAGEEKIASLVNEMSLRSKVEQMMILNRPAQDALEGVGGLYSEKTFRDHDIPPLVFSDYWPHGQWPRLYGQEYEQVLAQENPSINKNAIMEKEKPIATTVITQQDVLDAGLSVSATVKRIVDFGYTIYQKKDVKLQFLTGERTLDNVTSWTQDVQDAVGEFVEDQIAFGHTKEEMLASLKNVVDKSFLRARGVSERVINKRFGIFNIEDETALIKWTSYLQAAHGMSVEEIIDLFFKEKISEEDLINAGITNLQLQQRLADLGYKPGPINGRPKLQTENALWLFTYIQAKRNMTSSDDLIAVLRNEKDQFANTLPAYGIDNVPPEKVLFEPQKKSEAPIKKGGIDLNPNMINLQSQGQGELLNFNWQYVPQQIKNDNIEGFYPIIINITPPPINMSHNGIDKGVIFL